MNARQQKILSTIFASPAPKSVSFRDASSLLLANGCVILQGRGSRIRFVHGKTVLALHEPHPGKEIKDYQVKMVRDFLITIGVTP